MDWVEVLFKAIFAFVIMNVALVIVAFLVYFERKVMAHMPARAPSARCKASPTSSR